MSEFDVQKDEILAIKSIFESDNLFVNEDCRQGVFICSPVLQETPLSIVYSHDVNKSFLVNNLPPIELRFELPDNYPLTDPPRFLLSCEWISSSDLNRVCEQLDNLWTDTRSEILFIWFNFLLYDLTSFLKITSTYDITKLIHKAIRIKKDDPSTTNSISKEYIIPISHYTTPEICKRAVRHQRLFNDRGTKYFDRRARCISLGVELINRIKRYDAIRKKERFDNTWIDCGICLSSFFGSDTVAFGCDHYYCSKCIKTYIETLISEGQVNSLVCPSDKCDNSVDPEMVKILVKPELYQKYDALLLSSAIGKLEGVTYCPRTHCLKPIITENDPDSEKLVYCPYCDFAFCASCKMSYHGVDPCKSFADDEEKAKTLREYDEAGPEKKKTLEKEYGKKFLFQQLHEFKNKSWLKENSKQCPNCAFSIQKIDGCNKIHCSRCNCNFCWLCSAKLRSDNPYLHFRDKNSVCYAKLFEGVIQDEDTDDDDEWEEMEGFLFAE